MSWNQSHEEKTSRVAESVSVGSGLNMDQEQYFSNIGF